jgi:type VI protein secretion system component Hcp
MAKAPSTKPTGKPAGNQKPSGHELSADELVQVTGGKITMQDIHFTKKVDKASPDL